METLHLHIEYLLTRHDCVILPGIGALIVNESEASIDSTRGVIATRSRFISFNANVVTDDGLLTHSLARREHLSFEEAHRMLAAIIARMRADLKVEGEVSLGMTGRLLMDGEGLIRFEPRVSSLTHQPLSLRRVHEAKEKEEETAGFYQEDTAGDYAADETSQPEDKDYYVIRIPRRAVHAAAMIITILTVAVSLLIPINHDQQQKASVVPIPSPRAFAAPAQQRADTVISQPESENSHSLSPKCQAKRDISE